MIYVTSMPIQSAIVEYYLTAAGVIPSHARARLSLVSVDDSSPASLSEKLLERPRLLRRIAELILTGRARISFRTTRRCSSATSPSRWHPDVRRRSTLCRVGRRPDVAACLPGGRPPSARDREPAHWPTSRARVDACPAAVITAVIVKLNEASTRAARSWTSPASQRQGPVTRRRR